MIYRGTLLGILFGFVWGFQIAIAQGPPMTSDPDLRLLPGFDQPGEFPVTVTAANIDITPISGAELDGIDEDIFRAEFPAAGPIKWTSSRMNSGDIALSMGPAFPDNPLSYPSGDPGFQENFQAMNDDFNVIDTDSTELTTLSWRVSQRTGLHFATTRHNGVDDGYTQLDFSPIGPIRGVTYVSGFGGRQGWGFSMDTGAFENGGSSSTELHLGHAGDGLEHTKPCLISPLPISHMNKVGKALGLKAVLMAPRYLTEIHRMLTNRKSTGQEA